MASTFLFPDWLNRLRIPAGLFLAGAPVYLVCVVYGLGSPKHTDVGYQPAQPVEYSHALHVGQLGMDCRYCHTTVEKAAFAAVPPVETCLGCHQKNIRAGSGKLTPVRDAGSDAKKPLEWVKVHDLPDYVYFNHASHVTKGVGCASCHGRVDQMEKVYQHETLSMGWCLNCHRHPENHLRPVSEVTNMAYQPNGDQVEIGTKLKVENKVHPPLNCSTCHR